MLNKLIKPIAQKLPENNRFERIWKLAENDFKQRYKGSVLGLIWAFLNPLFRMAVYFFVFTYLFNSSRENFHVHLFSGLILWLFFQETTVQSINVFLTKRYLIENIQFNKIDLFISKALSSFIGLLFNTLAFVAMALLAGYYFSVHTLAWIPILIILYMFSVSVGVILATLKIFIKDIHHLWDMAMLAGFWTCPMFYDENILLVNYRFILYLNPVSILIIALRDCFLRNQFPDWNLMIYAAVYSIVIFCLAYVFLKKNEHLIIEKI